MPPLHGRWAEKAALSARLPGERSPIAGLGRVRAPGRGLGGPLLQQLPLVGLWLHPWGLGKGDVGRGHVEGLALQELLDGAQNSTLSPEAAVSSIGMRGYLQVILVNAGPSYAVIA